MKKDLKRQIREDEFVSGVERAWKWVFTHREQAQIVGLVAAVVLGGVLAFSWFRSSRAQESETAQAEALADYHAPLVSELPPGTPLPAHAFPSAKDKYTKALAGFEGVAQRFGSLPVSRRAAYYAALCRAELGETDAAVKALQALAARPGDDAGLLAAQAKLSLAALYARLGQTDNAVEAYRQIVQDAAAGLPRDYALLRLAGTLEDARRPAEAGKAYEQLAEDFPDSVFATEARRRAEYLKTAG